MKNNIKTLVIVMMFLLALSILTNYTLAQEKDSDLDGIPDSSDKYPFDYDNDGIPDIWEKKNGLRYDANDANEDPDNDGIKNIDEYKFGTDPWVTDKIKAKEPELFLPVEKVMARGLIWAGAALFIFIVFIFILYRAHIFRIFRFMHHVSKEHFEGRKIKAPIAMPQQRTAPMPQLKQKFMPPKEAPTTREYAKLPDDWGKLLEKRRKAWERQYSLKPFGKKKVTTIKKVEKPDVYIPLEELQKAYPRKDKYFERLAHYIRKKEHEDVFGRLSEHIHEHKKGKKYKESNLIIKISEN